MKHLSIAALGCAAFLAAGASQAALHDRGNGMIYDDVLDVTWLSDANYAATQYAATGGATGDADGKMQWAISTAWAANLDYNGITGWRLPSAAVGCNWQNCVESELGHLFFVDLGGTAGQSILTSTDPDMALFTNIQNYAYWDAELYSPVTSNAYSFVMADGTQRIATRSTLYNAWAVHDGDVAAVPEPETYALMLAGLGMVLLGARKRQA